MGSSALEHRVVIEASPERVWRALTGPELMPEWMGEPTMNVRVETAWIVGGPILISAFHHAPFQANGTVTRFEPPRVVEYTQRSSVSRLPDVPESYSTLNFTLRALAAGTELTVTVTGFPTETIRKHLDFYWRGTVHLLKLRAEAT